MAALGIGAPSCEPEGQIEAAPGDCLVQNILKKWYADKSCVVCRRQIAEIDWSTHRPALMSPERVTKEWREVPPETLPSVLVTHAPVCWDCHVNESFVRQHSDLVILRRSPEERHPHAVH